MSRKAYSKDQTTIPVDPGTVIIDTREKQPVFKEFKQALKGEAVVCREALYCGDLWLVGEKEEVLIERKTLSDLERSFFQERLDSEVAKMLNWRAKRSECFPDKLIRVRLMIEGSYVTGPIQMRLLTYQGLGLEVIWGNDGQRMLQRQYRSVLKGDHEMPKVRIYRPDVKKQPLQDQVLLPVLNKKQRTMIFGIFRTMLEFCEALDMDEKNLKKLPGFGPKTIEKLRKAFIWGS